MSKRGLFSRIAAAALVLLAAASLTVLRAGQAPAGTVAVDADDIGGVVTGAKGAEAGVWVIAETRDTPTRLIKSVVTDDQGRYLVPDLPKGNYDLWVRGYGLVDSQKVKATPGQKVNLKAVAAPNARAAAAYYPAQYWFSLLEVPPKTDFPGTGPQGNGISPSIKSQGEWIRNVINTDGCSGCHQLGSKATREMHPFYAGMKTAEAWEKRIQAGQAGGGMNNRFGQVGRLRAIGMYANWTDRVTAGELPTEAPARPQGRERNVVVTMWDWADAKTYAHDEIATDKRNPTVNANGPIYGALEESADYMPTVDPTRHTAGQVKLTVRDPKTPSAANTPPPQPSPYWGEETIWNSQTSTHSFAMDGQGRIWAASRIRQNATLPWCQAGSEHPSAKAFPLTASGRQLEMYDPKTKQTTPIDTCFSSGHVNLDNNDVLWSSFGPAGVEGWFDTKIWDKTHDEQKAQGWTAFILDTNGNGKRDAYTEPDQPIDPAKDHRINGTFYGVSPAPDGSVWGSVQGFPGGLMRLMPGSNPPATALAEVFNVPAPGFGARGADIDGNGVVWVSLASGHMGSFDRTKCKAPLNGPKATGDHCPEGWSFHQYPGPGFEGIGENSAESSYYTWVDQHDTFGLGRNVPMSTGNLNDGLIAYANGRMVVLRVPYPLGFYAKGLDGRIDDSNGGWKGRGLWAANGDRTPWLIEGGKGTRPLAAHFQLRPTPLAK